MEEKKTETSDDVREAMEELQAIFRESITNKKIPTIDVSDPKGLLNRADWKS